MQMIENLVLMRFLHPSEVFGKVGFRQFLINNNQNSLGLTCNIRTKVGTTQVGLGSQN